MGVVYKRLGDNENALEFYYESLEYNKNYHVTYLNISAIYIEEKEYKRSIDILTKGISENPYAEDLYYNRACCYAILEKSELAIKDIRKSLLLNPSIIFWVERDKDFKSLYDNREFKNILKEYSLKKSKSQRKGEIYDNN